MLKLKNNTTSEGLELVSEASVERQRVKQFMDDNLGKDYFDKYLKIRDRLTDMNLKDFNKIITLDPEDVKVAIDRYDSPSTKSSNSGGKKKVGENADWIVYHVTSFPAAQELGDGTKWCITGRYGNMDPNDDQYFNNYINNHNLDGGYYFYIPKDGSNNKYCLLLTKNGQIHSIWETPNGQVYDISDLNFPEVKGINLDAFEGDSEDILNQRLEDAYENDDADEWSYAEFDLNERGLRVWEYPELLQCIRDNKPNMFNMLLEWGMELDQEMPLAISYVYKYVDKDDREKFLSELRNYRNFDDSLEEAYDHLSDPSDIADFIRDFPTVHSAARIISDVGLELLCDIVEEGDNDVNDTLLDSNYEDVEELLEDINMDYNDLDNSDFIRFLRVLDDWSYLSFETAFDEGGRLHLNDYITDEGINLVDGEVVEILFNLGARLTDDEAEEWKEELDSMSDKTKESIDKRVIDIIEKSL